MYGCQLMSFWSADDSFHHSGIFFVGLFLYRVHGRQVGNVLRNERNLERLVAGRLHHNCRVTRQYDTVTTQNSGRPLQNQKLK